MLLPNSYPNINPWFDGGLVYTAAAVTNNVAFMNRLRPQINPTAESNRAIRWAASYGSLQAVTRLMQMPGVDPAAYRNAALKSAAMRGHRRVCDQLLTNTTVRRLHLADPVQLPPSPY